MFITTLKIAFFYGHVVSKCPFDPVIRIIYSDIFSVIKIQTVFFNYNLIFKMRIIFILSFVGCFMTNLLAQKITTIAEDKQLLNVQAGSNRKNAVVMGNKIFYITAAAQPNASTLAVVGLDGSNPKILTNVQMYGSNYLAATNKYIYFNSFVASVQYYQLFRYNPASDQVETVVNERGNSPWFFCGNDVSMSQMYTEGDKLVLAGTFRLTANADFRSLAIVEDEMPIAHILYLDEMPNTRDYRRLEMMYSPAFNDIAITDSSVYVYSMRSETKKKMLYIYSTKKGKEGAKYAVETIIDFSKYSYTPIHHQLVAMQGEVYTLVSLNSRPKDSKKVNLVQFNRKHNGNMVAEIELEEDNIFMQAVGSNLYVGNKNKVHHYSVKNGAQLIATTKGKGYFGYIQQEKRLLHAADGTIFLSHKQCYDNQTGKDKDLGLSKIIAIDPTFRTENVATIEKVSCNSNPYSEGLLAYDSCFVIGNTLCIMNHEKNGDWLMTYEKKNNWAATRLDYPEVKDFKKYYNGIAPIMTQLPNCVLVRAEYRKGKKQKKELMVQIQPLKNGETAPVSIVTKPSNVSQKPLKQVITDVNFAAAIREKYPECINEANKLLEPALTLTKLELNNKGIADLTGIEAFTALQVLYCGSNKITKMPTLPKNLEALYCFGNPLTSLPTLPKTLKILSCATTKLTVLPTLPNTLLELNCSVNQLTALPDLPNALTSLMCNENSLTVLPTLPSTLTEIYCQDNQLTILPKLPDALTNLACARNQLTTLPELPSMLETLICGENPLTKLPMLPKSLKKLYVTKRMNCLPNLIEGLEIIGETSRAVKLPLCN